MEADTKIYKQNGAQNVHFDPALELIFPVLWSLICLLNCQIFRIKIISHATRAACSPMMLNAKHTAEPEKIVIWTLPWSRALRLPEGTGANPDQWPVAHSCTSFLL